MERKRKTDDFSAEIRSHLEVEIGRLKEQGLTMKTRKRADFLLDLVVSDRLLEHGIPLQALVCPTRPGVNCKPVWRALKFPIGR